MRKMDKLVSLALYTNTNAIISKTNLRPIEKYPA
jgi:hypothetical protein